MGGLYDPSVRGNVSEYAEFNFFSDPRSADIVMQAAGKEFPMITTAGLEVTSRPECAVNVNSLALIKAVRSRASELAARILSWPVKTYSYFNLHDVFALFAFLHPEIFAVRKCSVRVAHSGAYTGRCAVTSGGDVAVCTKVVAPKFNQLLLDGLR
jgi:inosine-uridine nucleoside N-ribohydrolase